MSENDLANPGRLLKPIEVASLLNVSLASVYRWVNTGQLPAFRIGTDRRHGRLRIPFFSVEQLLQTHLDGIAGEALGVEREQVDA